MWLTKSSVGTQRTYFINRIRFYNRKRYIAGIKQDDLFAKRNFYPFVQKKQKRMNKKLGKIRKRKYGKSDMNKQTLH